MGRGGVAARAVDWHVVRVTAALALAGASAGCVPAPADPSQAQASTGGFGEPGTAPGQFAYPRVLEAIEFGGSEHLFVIDKAARIQWFEGGSERPRALWRTPRFDRGRPTGVAVHPPTGEDRPPMLYIADTHESRILVQVPPMARAAPGGRPASEAETIVSIGTYGRELGQFIYPCDIELLLDDDGAIERIYVAEYGGNDRVTIFDAQWNPISSFGAHGNAWEQAEGDDEVLFNRPQSLAIDRDARVLYIADAINHRVGRFTLDGELLGWLGDGGPSKQPGGFEFPYSVSVTGSGAILVAELGNSRVQLIDPGTGDRLALFGSPGRGDDDLLTPWEVASLGDRLYVLDSGNARVKTFALPRGIRLAGNGREGG